MLKVNKINVAYGKLQVIWDVSFEVRNGEFVTLIGSNGAGKSTILKTISGLMHPTSGTIEFLSQKIEDSASYTIVEAGLIHVPEGKKIFPFMSVYENLLMGGYTKEARKKISDKMEYVFQIFPVLKERKNQPAGTLSGGERQMLAIGIGLMACPKLLMLDEPLQGLSPLYAMKTLDAIKELNRRDKLTVLLVEQNVNYALEYAQRGYVIENGRITLSGTCSDLRGNEHVKKAYLGI